MANSWLPSWRHAKERGSDGTPAGVLKGFLLQKLIKLVSIEMIATFGGPTQENSSKLAGGFA